MNIKEFRRILHLNLQGFTVEEILKECNGYWSYGNNIGEPHALLTSGRHSDKYFRVNSALQFSNIQKWLGKLLVDKIKSVLNIRYIDCIVSSSYAAITFGKAVAYEFCSASIFTEKKDGKQVLTDRFELPPKTCLLQVEELITTLNTTKMVKEAVLKENPDVNFFEIDGKTIVATILHRPDKIKNYPDYRVIPLMEEEVLNWKPEECPLCKKGSEALNPKPNWSLFMSYQQ